MKVEVRLFARAQDLAGTAAVVVHLPAGSTAGDLRRRLREVVPALVGILERSALAVDEEFADDSRVLAPGARVALLPPVSGGAA